MRDWFFYVVWYVRLKRLLNTYYTTPGSCSDDALLNERFGIDGRDPEELKQEIRAACRENGRNFGRNHQHQEEKDESAVVRRIIVKAEGVRMSVYLSEIDKYKTKDQRMMTIPEVELEAMGLAYEGFSDFNSKVITRTGVIREVKGYYTKMESKKAPANNPTQNKYR